MGLYVRRDEERSELQKRIAAELRDKSKKNANQYSEIEPEDIDGVEDSEYIKGTKQTSPLVGVWIFLTVAAVAAVIYLIIRSN
jgi:hypothetical protein